MQLGALATTDELRAMPPWDANLRVGMLAYARILSRKFRQHEALCRAYIAEANLLAASTRRAIAKSASFTRAHAASQIRLAQKAGSVREDVDPHLAADVLTDALIIGVLRRSNQVAGRYSSDAQLEGTIEIFIRGIEPTPSVRTPSKRRK